jgi:hypothetical protein
METSGRRFWEVTHAETYADPPVQAVRRNPMELRSAALMAYAALEDEERRESGRELQVIHLHTPQVSEGFPLRGPRSAGVALLQD